MTNKLNVLPGYLSDDIAYGRSINSILSCQFGLFEFARSNLQNVVRSQFCLPASFSSAMALTIFGFLHILGVSVSREVGGLTTDWSVAGVKNLQLVGDRTFEDSIGGPMRANGDSLPHAELSISLADGASPVPAPLGGRIPGHEPSEGLSLCSYMRSASRPSTKWISMPQPSLVMSAAPVSSPCGTIAAIDRALHTLILVKGRYS